MTASPLALRLLVFLTWILALAAIVGVGVELFWRLNTPAPLETAPQFVGNAREAAARVGAARPFGGEAGLPTAPASSARVRLFGVATGFAGGPGFAMLSVDGAEARAFVQGEEIQPGLRLDRLYPDRVELLRGQTRQSIALEADPSQASSAPSAPHPSPHPSQMLRPPPGVSSAAPAVFPSPSSPASPPTLPPSDAARRAGLPAN